MQKMSSAPAKTGCASLVARTSENSLNRNDSLPQNFSWAVYVRQEHVERAQPLLKPTLNLVPFIAGENLWQQIAEPGVVMFARRDFERDSKFAQRRVQPFFEFPQIGGCRSFQLADNFRVRSARFSSPLAQHFVPPFLRAISVPFCHAGLLSVNWKPLIAQVWMQKLYNAPLTCAGAGDR
jgi:hypothetical protein